VIAAHPIRDAGCTAQSRGGPAAISIDYHSDCASDGVFPPGTTVREPGGPGEPGEPGGPGGPRDVHLGRNLGDAPPVLEVPYVLPHGAPFSQDVPNPGCSFE
jgi:hypothetical protein